MSGYTYLALTVVCSVGIGVVFKVAGLRKFDQLVLITVNYLCAGSVAFLLSTGDAVEVLMREPEMLAAGISTGIVFVAGYFALSAATRAAGIALTMSVSRVSVIIPFLASWFIWGESTSAIQLAGLGLALCSFVLISRPQQTDRNIKNRQAWFLLFVFILGGLADSIMKYIDNYMTSTTDILTVSAMIFIAAACLTFAASAVRYFAGRLNVVRGAIMAGVILGLLNLGTVVFILQTLAHLPGTFVFPANNVSIVLLSTGAGVVVWDEHLTLPARIGLVLAALSLVLLGAG